MSTHVAFVVHFDTRRKITRRRLAGQIEHVVSGKTSRFESLGELIRFVDRTLGEIADGEDPT